MAQGTKRDVAVITGASGFIGSHLRDALLDDGVDVVALRRAGSPEPSRGRSAVVDYEDTDALAELMAQEKPRHVYHVAGATKGVTYEDFRRGNVMPTRNLAAAIQQGHPGVDRLVHVSSLAAHGPADPERPRVEEDAPAPVEFYGQSKLESEEVLRALDGSLPWTVIRPASVYGPRDVDNFELFRAASWGINLFFGNRHRRFSIVHVDDVVASIRACTRTSATLGRGYFVCDGEPISWDAFQRHIVEASGRGALTINLPEFVVDLAALGGELAAKLDGKPRLFNRQKATMGRQQSWTCQHDAARRDFGYRPSVRLQEGVERTFAWYRDEGWI